MSNEFPVYSNTKFHIIEALPHIMGEKGFEKAALLMEHWLNSPSRQYPNYGPPNTDIITMDWALGFPQVKGEYDKLVENNAWLTDKTKEQLFNAQVPKLTKVGESARFGDLSKSVVDLNRDNYITNIAIYPDWYKMRKDYNFIISDLHAALNNFSFRVAVEGKVKLLNIGEIERRFIVLPEQKKEYEIEIDKVGFYIRDSYDFEDDNFINKIKSQRLACWGYENDKYFVERDCLQNLPTAHDWSLSKSWKTDLVNKDFRDYRLAREKGGDFKVFSDVKVFNISESFTYYDYLPVLYV